MSRRRSAVHASGFSLPGSCSKFGSGFRVRVPGSGSEVGVRRWVWPYVARWLRQVEEFKRSAKLGPRAISAEPSLVPHANHSFFFQAEDGIRDLTVTGVQTCALPI